MANDSCRQKRINIYLAYSQNEIPKDFRRYICIQKGIAMDQKTPVQVEHFIQKGHCCLEYKNLNGLTFVVLNLYCETGKNIFPFCDHLSTLRQCRLLKSLVEEDNAPFTLHGEYYDC